MLDLYRRLAKRAARFYHYPARVRIYVLELMFYLLLSRLALRLLPYRWLIWIFERPPKQYQEPFTDRRQFTEVAKIACERCKDENSATKLEKFRSRVQWLTDQADWFLPGKSVCFPRAIAAQAFMRRFGIGTTLVYGAATFPESGLTSHVWLQAGDEIIIGQHEGQNYHILARYPDV